MDDEVCIELSDEKLDERFGIKDTERDIFKFYAGQLSNDMRKPLSELVEERGNKVCFSRDVADILFEILSEQTSHSFQWKASRESGESNMFLKLTRKIGDSIGKKVGKIDY